MTTDCSKCKHFYVTWDKNAPRGCRAYGFKTEGLPSLAVHEVTGIGCQAFEPKRSTVKRQSYEIVKN